MIIIKATSVSGKSEFIFQTPKKDVVIESESLLDAKLEFQVRYGYWPKGTAHPQGVRDA